MKISLAILFVFISYCTLAQITDYSEPVVIDTLGTTLHNYNIAVLQDNDTLYFRSFSKIDTKKLAETDKLLITHIGYENYTIAYPFKIPNTIVLKREDSALDAVIVTQQYKKDNINLAQDIARLFSFKSTSTNSSFDYQYAAFRNSEGEYIQKMDIHLVKNFSGVKNIDRGVFKIALYTVDSITDLPLKPFYRSDTLKNVGKSSTYSLELGKEHIKTPKEGFFVVFELLDIKCYTPQFVNAKFGRIAATPMVKNKYKPRRENKTYFRHPEGFVTTWQPIKIDLKIDVYYEK